MQHTLGFRGQRQLDRSRNPLTQQGAAFYLSPNRFNCDLGAGEKAAGQSFVFAHQAQQEMLGLNRGRTELRRLVTRKEDYPSRFFSIAFEHTIRRRLSMIARRL
jgi:hypothetical protein